ncbi:MAG: hypothetical protein ACOVNY_09245 [Chitinophagaceae bacterium]
MALLQLADILPSSFDSESKVWIYQSSRILGISEAFEVEQLLENFVTNWKSHGTPIKGYANLLYGQFIVLMADETATGVSGCSTDSSVHLMKEIEQKLNIDLFNRQLLAFYIKDKVQLLPLSQLQHAVQNGFITKETLYFNNLVATKEQLIQLWLVPVKDTWLGKRLEILQHTS